MLPKGNEILFRVGGKKMWN